MESDRRLKTLALVLLALAILGMSYAIYDNPKRGGTTLAVYFIIWWTSLFAVLPFRARSQVEAGEVVPGSEPGAPANTHLLWYGVVNSIVAAVIYAVLHFAIFPLF